jgi:pantothenate kinase type III
VKDVKRYGYDDVPWTQILDDVDEVRLSLVGPSPERLFALAQERGKKILRVRDIQALHKDEQWARVNAPAALGEDRLAAILGARHRAQGCDVLVIDCGTCLTTDLVHRDGEHLGGIISPGLRLRLESMHEHTAALPSVSPEGDAPVWALTTEGAMRGGALNGLRYEMDGYIRAARERLPEVQVFYTGGIPLNLSERALLCPNLVLEGLL